MLHHKLLLFFYLLQCRRVVLLLPNTNISLAQYTNLPRMTGMYNGHQTDTEEGNWEEGNWRLWLTTPVNY